MTALNNAKRNAYLAEFLATGGMLAFGLFAVAVFWSAYSPLATLAVSEATRRLMTGFFFAGGATALIYSPLGQVSGGHINPSVTLAFYSLSKISGRDTLAYIFAQFSGAVCGIAMLHFVLVYGLGWMDAVTVGATMPGEGFSLWFVFAAEFALTMVLMLAILVVSNRVRIHRFTPLIAGSIVMTAVWLEAHVSGTSLNEARSLAPALFGGVWEHHWIYVVAPVLGAQLAALLYKLVPRYNQVLCCKLYHPQDKPCHFEHCNFPGTPHASP
jgi:aquaporin Z